ncbi:hypothetical protein PVAND_013584 [Polypedilum vanderplanki]|uniref:Transmembrane protein 230 n=1 Tax=Polypedilum vanderplanki TaxID=319348 RepID=A0A9J6CQR7_POLVA|nr:hypothetical protein PVAND_013584 [Polypedilum vanderplanki]
MRRNGYNSIKDSKEPENDTVDGRCQEDIEEAQFIDTRNNEQKPYTTLCLIFFLFFMGLLTLIISILIIVGHLHEGYNDRMIPLLILGLIMFIPGAYYTRIVYFIARGRQGYNYDMIPSCS